MITGYNTDVTHDGVVYHVQTEDKGLDTPLILSLVYTGGTIIAAKRSPYDDLIASGFNESVLSERLQRQHKLICAAIHSGRVNDLARMSSSDPAAPPARERVPAPAPPPPSPKAGAARTTQPPPVVRARFQGKADFALARPGGAPIAIRLVEEKDLRSGENVTLRILVTAGSEDGSPSVPGAEAKLKVLGTSFRPVTYAAKSDQNGVANFQFQIPRFTSGRAAILIQASAGGHEAELRRIILQA